MYAYNIGIGIKVNELPLTKRESMIKIADEILSRGDNDGMSKKGL